MFQPFLSSEQYHSVVIDLRLEDSLAKTTELIKQQVNDSPVILVGFSMGGMLAFDFIRKYPEQVKGLCLLNSNCHEDLPGRKVGRDQHLLLAMQQGMEKLMTQVYLPVYFSKPECAEANLVQDMAIELGVEVFNAQLLILANRPDSKDTLANFTHPILIIGAENDLPCPPEHQQDMALSNDNAEITIIENAGHFAPLEQPEQIKSLLEQWVSKNYD